MTSMMIRTLVHGSITAGQDLQSFVASCGTDIRTPRHERIPLRHLVYQSKCLGEGKDVAQAR